jgi:hypothetical protein
MKKLIMLAAVLGLTVSSAFSQGWEWGAKAGVNMAKFTKTTGLGTRTGIYVGVFGEYVISSYVGIQGELLYSQMGAKLKATSSTAASTMKYDYITIPMLAKVYVMENLSLDLGPQFGFLASSKHGNATVQGMKKFDTSFAAGLSYKIIGRIDVSARYNLGLTKVSDKMTDDNEKKISPKNNVIAVSVGYRF